MITETDEVAEALRAAARQWPEVKRPGELLQRLIAAGYHHLRASGESRKVAVEDTSGALTGAYGTDYLAELREEWPA